VNRLGIPQLGLGAGLRAAHYAEILERDPEVDWFEIISENYMFTEGRPLHFLDRIREKHRIVMHGVSLSLGSPEEVDANYLEKLVRLRDRVSAAWVSDHLCFTGTNTKNSHDLLPVPYTEETLLHIARKVRRVQDALGAPLVIENPSSYISFRASTMHEADFLRELTVLTNCGLLLDVNNVFVSAHNHHFDAREYLAKIPMDCVVQLHVAGHAVEPPYLIDTHEGPVLDEVWELYREVVVRSGCRNMLLEWDENIPSFEVVVREARRSESFASAREAS
jgi:uncharacterized protein